MHLPRLPPLLGCSLGFLAPAIVQAAQIPTALLDQSHSNVNHHYSPSFSPELVYDTDIDDENDSWDLSVPPNENATGHLVFETVHSLMQHWPNTRYRNGHSLVPGTVPAGTVLYHGRSDSNTPTKPEWLATDPEHSYMFCRSPGGGRGRGPGRVSGTAKEVEREGRRETKLKEGQDEDKQEEGCWMLVITTTQPLSILYFDGSSAAKMRDGAMDSQDILAYGEVLPDKFFSERERIDRLCEWAKGMDVDGFVRMEMDFEIMLCDFTQGVQVEALNLRSHRRGGPGGPPPRGPGGPPQGPGGPGFPPPGDFHHPPPPPFDTPYPPPPFAFASTYPSSAPSNLDESFHSGTWHNFYPGETRIQLDLTRLVSFYDTSLVPSLVEERFGKRRIEHRLLGISEGDLKGVVTRVEEELTLRSRGNNNNGGSGSGGSGIDWATLIRLIVKRFSDRLEMVQYMLNATETGIGVSANKDIAKNVQTQLLTMLQPYMLVSTKPPPPSLSTEDLLFASTTANSSTQWASPLYQRCSTTYTNYIVTTPSLYSRLTSSERLILGGVKETTREICRVVVGMWVDGVMAGLDTELYEPPSAMADDNDDNDDKEDGTEINMLLESWSERINALMQRLDWNVWLKCRPACGFEEMCYLPTWPFRRGSDDPSDPQPKCIRRMTTFDGQMEERL
ncbi:hypothetical protein GYMLUDRAFT_45667 [Collybiopsis luxurians FD-317 M1]|uniref:Uncharacterized protein n=1 Tax=Collybiopsis luxurians FD-317 M1 TaxID=944289 RepID=A0A0D0B4B7_9AGAR|nr:hypothetical protein GYMLUDRAFT_45667 [Collybiopsis luxurians FD-317 M1]